MNSKEYLKKRREMLKAQGKCECGKESVFGGMCCQECLDKANKRRETLKAQGKCRCGRDKDFPNNDNKESCCLVIKKTKTTLWGYLGKKLGRNNRKKERKINTKN